MSEVEFIDIFADNLRDLIIESGYSISEIAREIGINKSTLSKYLRKERLPSIDILVNLSIFLLCDIEDLIPDYEYVF